MNNQEFWFVIQSHPNKEQMLYKQLELLNIEVFFPRIRVKPVNPRSRKVRPYFPGYIFIHTDQVSIDSSSLKWMPHSKGIVSFGGEASIVLDSLILALKQKMGDLNEMIEQREEIKSGTPVLIDYGPFEGYEGIFDTRLKGSDRVRILLKMLSDNYVPVEIESSHIQKKQNKS